jgi:hypothetical protein
MKINWPIVIAFVLIIVLVTGAVIIRLNQPVDSQELKTEIQDLQSAAAEGINIAAQTVQLPDEYFELQLRDLQQNVDDSREKMEKWPYLPSIAEPRQKYLEISKQVSDHLHALSLAYQDPGQLSAEQDQLKQLKDALENVQ